ncbi:MAG TPA: GldM family protein [Chitinophagales bacterium]|nr:GldM family protein [Chitinophagales bacterium]
MINLMYLVLTALLALNVSAEILHAFHVVNSGLDVSSSAETQKNNQTFAAFNEQLKNDKERTTPFFNKAQQAKQLSDKLYDSIEDLKRQIISGSKGIVDNVTHKHLDKEDLSKDPYKSMPVSELMKKGELFDDRNLEVSTNVMINNGNGDRLKAKINTLRNNLLSLVDDPNEKKNLEAEVSLKAVDPTEKMDGVLKNWSETNFEMVPTIAAITLLNKFQNDIRNSEGLIVEYLLRQVNAKTVVVDRIQAKVIAASSYVMAGQPYKADIFVAAYSSTVKPMVYIGELDNNIAKKDAGGNFLELTENPVRGGGTEMPVENGMGHYEVVAGGEGDRPYSGAAMILGPDGKPRYYPFEAKYQVAKGAAVIASDSLNIIYAGIPNPFSVSVPGFPADKVNAAISQGQFTKTGAGKYSAVIPTESIGKKVSINVSIQTETGARQIGTQSYVIRRIPNPVAKINGITEGDIPVTTLKVSPGIGAVLTDFYFGGVKFSVTSFECVYTPRRQDVKIEQNSGARWTGKVAEFIAGAKPGDQIIFRKIKAIGPDKTTRSLNSIPLQIK